MNGIDKKEIVLIAMKYLLKSNPRRYSFINTYNLLYDKKDKCLFDSKGNKISMGNMEVLLLANTIRIK